MLFKLLCGHALADFALQNNAMAKGKNPHNKPDYIPAGQKDNLHWLYWLAAHGLISGGVVFLITQNIWCGVAETVLHCGIDFLKCDNRINLHTDQFLHFLCRVLYTGAVCSL